MESTQTLSNPNHKNTTPPSRSLPLAANAQVTDFTIGRSANAALHASIVTAEALPTSLIKSGGYELPLTLELVPTNTTSTAAYAAVEISISTFERKYSERQDEKKDDNGNRRRHKALSLRRIHRHNDY